MKKIIFAFAIIAMAAAAFAQTASASRRVIADYEGKSAGMQMPEWVMAATDNSIENLASALGIDTNKSYMFCTMSRFTPEEYASISKDWIKAEALSQTIESVGLVSFVKTQGNESATVTSSKIRGVYCYGVLIANAKSSKITFDTKEFWSEISKANLPANYKYAVLKESIGSAERKVFNNAADAKKFCEQSVYASGDRDCIKITAFNDACFEDLSLFKNESFWTKTAMVNASAKLSPGQEPKPKDIRDYFFTTCDVYTIPRAKYEEMLREAMKANF